MEQRDCHLSSIPIACVAGVIRRRDEAVLCVKRSKEPGAGKWTLPGGHIEYHETGEQAIIREVREETALVCRAAKFIGVYEYIEQDYHLIILIFDCKCDEGPIQPGDDANDVAWFPDEELNNVPKTDGLFERVVVLQTNTGSMR